VSTFASWIHGNAVVLEGSAEHFVGGAGTGGGYAADGTYVRVTTSGGELHVDDVVMMHMGWGTVAAFRSQQTRWFHIPLPSPVIYDGRRSKMVRFFLLWKIVGGGSLEFIHLYDGFRMIPVGFTNAHQAPDGRLGYPAGDHSLIDDFSRFELGAPAVSASGFGLSFQVKGNKQSELTVTAAGADFEYAE